MKKDFAKIKIFSHSYKLFFLILWKFIFFTMLLNSLSYSQNQKNNFSHDLVVGELLGKINPDDLFDVINSAYYPFVDSSSAIILERQPSLNNLIIYKILYLDNNQKNKPQRLVFRFFESEHDLKAALITDEVDFAITESLETAEEIHNSTLAFQIMFRYKPPNLVKMVGYNNRHPILKNVNVRQALSYAINGDYLFRRVLKQAAYFADGPLSSESKLHGSGLKYYKYNPKKASQLLKEANLIDTNSDGIIERNGEPVQLSLIYRKGIIIDEKFARRIKFDWNKLGIDVIREPLTQKEIEERIASRDFDVILLNHQFQETIQDFEDFFKSTGKNNFLGYKNNQVDRYFDRYFLVDPPSRLEIFKQGIQMRINEDQPASFLFFLWLDRYFVNRIKFSNFMDKNGRLRPFNEWILLKQ